VWRPCYRQRGRKILADAPRETMSRPTQVRWRTLAVLVVMSFVGYFLRTNMSVAGDSMMRDLGLSQVQLGMILGAFAWGYALFQIPGGVFGDVVGGRRALAWIAVLWGVVNLLTGLLPGPEIVSLTALLVALAALRFLMGVTQAPLFPVMGGRVIGDWFPPGGRALPNGLSSSGLTLGAAATGPLIAWLAETVGWRASFAVTAPLAWGAAALWWWYARDRPSQHASVNEAELALIQCGQAESVETETGAWKLVLRDRNVLLLTASYFCMNYVFYIFFNWFFVYLVQVRGFAAVESLDEIPRHPGRLPDPGCDQPRRRRPAALGRRGGDEPVHGDRAAVALLRLYAAHRRRLLGCCDLDRRPPCRRRIRGHEHRRQYRRRNRRGTRPPGRATVGLDRGARDRVAVRTRRRGVVARDSRG